MNKKRILSLLLAIVMVISLVPTYVFATEGQPTDSTVTEPVVTDPIAPLALECETCGAPDCTSTHENWCEICKKDDCGQTHAACDKCGTVDCQNTHENWCEICKKDDCGQTHAACDKCGTVDCQNTHENWCEICKKDDCGQTHTACDKCGTVDCQSAHENWCDVCKVDACGQTHTPGNAENPSEPSQPSEGETEPSEPAEKTLSEQLLELESTEEMYALVLEKMESAPDQLIALTAEEIADLRERIAELDPEGDDTDTQDLLDTLAILPNAPAEEKEIPVLPDLIAGDYDSIIAHLDALYEEAKELKSYDECDDLFDRLFVVTLAAVESDELLITSEQMRVVNRKYEEIMEFLERRFGYTDGSNSIALYSRSSAGFTVKSNDVSSGVEYSKGVAKVDDNEYLLTLDAFVTGEAATITKTKPADIVLVLDQSASMYAPMGASGGKNNSQVWDADDFGGKVTQYTKAQWKSLFEKDASLYQKASQLGYFVAQSRGGGYRYCEGYNVSGHSHTNECRTYDWFVVQYLPNGDSSGNHWYLYRIKQTANPSRDSQTYSKGEISHVAAPMKYESFDDMPSFYFYKSQYGALYDAISSFGKGIVEANAGHRLAVVGFSAGAEYKMYADGSGIYVNGNYKQYNTTNYYTGYASDWATKRAAIDTLEKFYGADTLTANDYKSALMNADNNMTNIMASINAVKSDSWGTNHDVGMDMANKIFEQNPVDTSKRDRIVLVFTDGAPSSVSTLAYQNAGYVAEGNTSAQNVGLRDMFVKFAYTAKTEHKAQIYTIWTSTLATASSQFMRYASSDYPNAQNYKNPGTQIASPKYASGVKSGEELMNAFGSVFEDVSNATTTELKTETVIRDIIAPSFTLPTPDVNGWDEMTEEQQNKLLAEQIEVYESKYKGKNVFAESGETGYTKFDDAIIVITKTQNDLYQVDVKNYDFSTNYVADLDSGGYVGAKLVIKVPIIVKPDFLGGDDVVTNGIESGIYTGDGTMVGQFEVPQVDISVKAIAPIGTEQNIYVSQQVNLPNAINLGEFKVGTTTYRVDGINNAYVDIVYTLKDAEGNTVTYTIPAGTPYESMTGHGWDETGGLGTHPILENDKDYTVTCQLFSKLNTDNDSTNDTANNSELKSDALGVDVYKPVITFKDSAIDLGDTADYATENLVKVEWKHGNDLAPDSMGTAPTLEFTYDPPADDFKKETDVKVTEVKALQDATIHVPVDMIITDHAIFYREMCSAGKDGAIFPGCDHTAPILVSSGGINFTVHLNNFDIVITKDVTGNYIDPNQSFVFNVTGPNGFNMNVMVVGEGSVTIKGVPAGVYTVKELTEWSWRYICTDDEKTVSAEDAVNGVSYVTFENTRDKEFWLSGDCVAENWFHKK